MALCKKAKLPMAATKQFLKLTRSLIRDPIVARLPTYLQFREGISIKKLSTKGVKLCKPTCDDQGHSAGGRTSKMATGMDKGKMRIEESFEFEFND
ncbi:hypothetical protein Gotur_016400 [Gossypium turneri]